MVTMGVFPFQGKTHMVEPGIEPGTWLNNGYKQQITAKHGLDN